MPSSQDTEAIDLGDGFTMKYETEETSPIARTAALPVCFGSFFFKKISVSNQSMSV